MIIMPKFSLLIRDYDNIRRILRDIYIYGCYSRDDFIKHNVNRPLETAISAIDGNIQEIRDSRANRSSSCRTLENLQKECRYLIQDIHARTRT